MEFRENEAIYIQIADFVSDYILSGKWAAEQKIPSVRDLAIDLQVNPNTVMRAYEHLQKLEVIYNKRGLGFFVSADGHQKVLEHRKAHFFEQILPELFKEIALLRIELKEIQERYNQFLNQQA
jgi:DNA-binding transcriptional regulator YhcF (GntR family)